MSKHTPGPWQWMADKQPIDIATYKSPGFYNNLELYGPKDEPVIECGKYTVVRELANAHLIAAAPNLLAELQNIANADPSKWDADMRDQFQQWAQSRARAAIAKAEGDAPCAD